MSGSSRETCILGSHSAMVFVVSAGVEQPAQVSPFQVSASVNRVQWTSAESRNSRSSSAMARMTAGTSRLPISRMRSSELAPMAW